MRMISSKGKSAMACDLRMRAPLLRAAYQRGAHAFSRQLRIQFGGNSQVLIAAATRSMGYARTAYYAQHTVARCGKFVCSCIQRPSPAWK